MSITVLILFTSKMVWCQM